MSEPSSSKEISIKDDDTSLTNESVGRAGEATVMVEERKSLFWYGAVMVVRGSLQFVIMAAILVGAAFLMEQLADSRKERPKRQQKEAVYTVDTLIAKASTNQPTMSVFGEVVAGRVLNLTSLVGGTVIDVNPDARVGARLEKGEPLLKINPFSFEIALKEAKANLKEAEAAVEESKARIEMEETGRRRTQEQLELAESDLERAQELFNRGALTRRDVEVRELTVSQRKASFQTSGANINIQKAQLEAREASVDRLQATVASAEEDLNKTTLKVPFDAVVQEVNVELGQTVTNAISLFTLYEADTLDARFVLSDGQFGRLINEEAAVKGKSVDVVWNVGNASIKIPAKIDRVGAQVAADRGGISVFARLDNNQNNRQVRPGAFVTVSVPDQTFNETFRLPETALFEGNVVYVVGPENRLEARQVEIAAYDAQHIIVKDGLSDGDEVLVTQIAEVGEGILVRREDDKPENAQDLADKAKAAESRPKS